MDAVQAVGAGIESVGQAVGGVIEGALNDPIGTIAKVAAIATQQYWMLPLISLDPNSRPINTSSVANRATHSLASGCTRYPPGHNADQEQK